MKELERWQLVNPEGIMELKSLNATHHPETLDGKKVLLRWNGKSNGDVFLNRLAEILTANTRGLTIIKNWEVAPETVTISSNSDLSKRLSRKLAEFEPDLAIGMQGD